MLAYVEGDAAAVLKTHPRLDRDASHVVAKELFPSEKLEEIEDGDLSYTCPQRKEIYVGCFPGVSIVAADEFGVDYPSRLDQRFLRFARGEKVYLHAMHSVVDWFAYAIWERGQLLRSLSLSPDHGVIEDIGARRAFEEPYWAGEHPVGEPGGKPPDYPFPFHPLDLGEAALLDLFGYQLEGIIDEDELQPEDIPLVGFKRVRPWWKLW
jgi:hypothetical protein